MTLNLRFTNSSAFSLALWLGACSVNVNEKHWNLAEQYAQQGQFLRAIEEYTRVVNFGQKSPLAIRAQMSIAQIYDEQLKDYPRAIRAWRDVLRRSDDSGVKIQSRIAVAQIYMNRMENPLAAAEEYSIVLKENPDIGADGPKILLSLARALLDASRYSDAAEKFKLFLANYPGHQENARVLYELGRAYLSGGKLLLAKTTFQELIAKLEGRPGQSSLVAEAYFGLGETYESMEDMKMALEAYKQSLATYPNKEVIELKIDRISKRAQEKAVGKNEKKARKI